MPLSLHQFNAYLYIIYRLLKYKSCLIVLDIDNQKCFLSSILEWFQKNHVTVKPGVMMIQKYIFVIILLYLKINKCSFGEHKRFLSKNIYVKNRFQTFEHLCVSCTSLTVGCVSFSSFVVLRSWSRYRTGFSQLCSPRRALSEQGPLRLIKSASFFSGWRVCVCVCVCVCTRVCMWH